RQQVRHVQNRRPLAEVLADALFLGERISHSELPSFQKVATGTHFRRHVPPPGFRKSGTPFRRRAGKRASRDAAARGPRGPGSGRSRTAGRVIARRLPAKGGSGNRTRHQMWMLQILLLELDGCSCFLELLLEVLGVGLADPFLDHGRRPLDRVLGLLQAQSGDWAPRLDDRYLVGPYAG